MANASKSDKRSIEIRYDVAIMESSDGTVTAYGHGGRVVAVAKSMAGLEKCLKKQQKLS